MISPRFRFVAVVCLSAITVPAMALPAGALTPQVQAPRVVPSEFIADLARRLLGYPPRTSPAGGSQNGSSSLGTLVVDASLPPSAEPASPAAAPVTDGPSWSATVVDTSAVFAKFATSGAAPITPIAVIPVVRDAPESGTERSSLLRLLATVVAGETKVDPLSLESVWLRTDERRMRVILSALAQVGTPYRYAGNQPGGFDCSGLTSFSWQQVGVKLPRSSGDQINALAPRAFQQLEPGDIIWRPGHVGMYLGAGDAMVHSPQTGKSVEVRKMGKAIRFGSPWPNS